MNAKEKAAMRRHGGQLARFGGVGVLCAITDFSLFAVLVALGAPPVPANVGSFLVANVEGYFLNGRVTFGGLKPLSLKGYSKYFSAYAVSLILSTLIVGALASRVGPLYAKLAATGVAAIWNYLFVALVVFRRPAETPRE